MEKEFIRKVVHEVDEGKQKESNEKQRKTKKKGGKNII